MRTECSFFSFFYIILCLLRRQILSFIIHLTHYLFADWPKACSEFSKSARVTSLAADYTILMSRTLKVTGNHVMYDSSIIYSQLAMKLVFNTFSRLFLLSLLKTAPQNLSHGRNRQFYHCSSAWACPLCSFFSQIAEFTTLLNPRSSFAKSIPYCYCNYSFIPQEKFSRS